MSEQVVGYVVRVFDGSQYRKGLPILHEQEFRAQANDPPGYALGNALKRAERHAQHLEQLIWPGKYVEVDCIWEGERTER